MACHGILRRSSKYTLFEVIEDEGQFARERCTINIILAGDLAAVGGVFKDAIAIAFDGEGTSAAQDLLSAFDDVTDYINNDVLVKSLDSTSLPSYCGEECLEKSVWVRLSIA